MKLTNPTGRPIIATMFGRTRDDYKTLTIDPGDTYETDDYVEASTLVEYGASADPVDLQAAREAHADRNRKVNSRTASASASEGEILERHKQRTVSVADGTVDPADLKGERLDEAVKAANDEGAGISTSGKADEKRDALAAWRARGPAEDEEEFVKGEDDELEVDDEGQPYALDDVERDEETGEILRGEDGKPVRRPADA